MFIFLSCSTFTYKKKIRRLLNRFTDFIFLTTKSSILVMDCYVLQIFSSFIKKINDKTVSFQCHWFN